MSSNKINHEIPLLIQTESSNCVQTTVAMLLGFYGQHLTAEEIQSKIPVRKDSQGKPYGTLLMDIAVWIKSLGLSVILDCFDCEIIDRSWKGLSNNEIVNKLKKLKESKRQTVVPFEIRNVIIDSYISMLDDKIKFNISRLSNDYLWNLIKKGPYLTVVSYNYLYDAPRSKYIMEKKKYEPDDIEGKTASHAVVVTGMDDEKIYINDPDDVRGGKNSFPVDHFIASIATAQNKASNWVLSICTMK
jgi:uncharacterized protein YvpB